LVYPSAGRQIGNLSTNAIQHQGKSFPPGATLNRNGANFSVFAKQSAAAPDFWTAG
jgi:hypothetical protein